MDPDWLGYLLVQPHVILEYALALFLPSRVVLLSGLDRPALGAAPVLGLALLAALLAGAIALRRRAPLLSFTLLWGAVALAPTSIFAISTSGDLGRVHLASFGVILLVALALAHLGRALGARASLAARPLFVALPTVVVAVLCAAGTMVVNAHHADRKEVWSHLVALYPRHPLSNTGLCGELAGRDDVQAALRQCQRAWTLKPDAYLVPHLVSVLARTGRAAQAEQLIQGALGRLDPAWVIHLAHGHLLWFQDRWSEAAAAYGRVLEQSPASVEARLYLADCWRHLGRTEKLPALLQGLQRGALPPSLVPLWQGLRSIAGQR